MDEGCAHNRTSFIKAEAVKSFTAVAGKKWTSLQVSLLLHLVSSFVWWTSPSILVEKMTFKDYLTLIVICVVSMVVANEVQESGVWQPKRMLNKFNAP
jgi:hypothetical protein